jgi:hypothetical protein
MTLEFYLRAGTLLLAAGFVAGTSWRRLLSATRKSQQDVNALGGKLRAKTEKDNDRFMRVGFALLTFCDPEKREKVLKCLLEEEKDKP